MIIYVIISENTPAFHKILILIAFPRRSHLLVQAQVAHGNQELVTIAGDILGERRMPLAMDFLVIWRLP